MFNLNIKKEARHYKCIFVFFGTTSTKKMYGTIEKTAVFTSNTFLQVEKFYFTFRSYDLGHNLYLLALVC